MPLTIEICCANEYLRTVGARYPCVGATYAICSGQALSLSEASFCRMCPASWTVAAKCSSSGAVNLAGAQRDRGVQGLGGLGVGGMGQAAAVSPVISFQTANRRVISVR